MKKQKPVKTTIYFNIVNYKFKHIVTENFESFGSHPYNKKEK